MKSKKNSIKYRNCPKCSKRGLFGYQQGDLAIKRCKKCGFKNMRKINYGLSGKPESVSGGVLQGAGFFPAGSSKDQSASNHTESNSGSAQLLPAPQLQIGKDRSQQLESYSGRGTSVIPNEQEYVEDAYHRQLQSSDRRELMQPAWDSREAPSVPKIR